jgi:acetylglutamate kinase
MADRLGVETQMIDGRRVTDKETLDIVTMVYGGLVNKQVVTLLHTMGVNAIGLTGADGGWMRSVKRPIKNGIDYGFVGDVTEVNGEHLRMLLDNGLTPVIAPITYSEEGLLLNTNADTVASETAIALVEATGERQEARGDVQLTFCFEKAGVLRDADEESTLIPRITRESYKQLLAEYDNSILYNDYVVNELLQRFVNEDAIVFYFSDHGIDAFKSSNNYIGHANPNDTISIMVSKKIPFMVYSSQFFCKKHPELQKRIENAVNRPYRTDSIMYTIMDVAGVETVNGISYKHKSLFK